VAFRLEQPGEPGGLAALHPGENQAEDGEGPEQLEPVVVVREAE